MSGIWTIVRYLLRTVYVSYLMNLSSYQPFSLCPYGQYRQAMLPFCSVYMMLSGLDHLSDHSASRKLWDYMMAEAVQDCWTPNCLPPTYAFWFLVYMLPKVSDHKSLGSDTVSVSQVFASRFNFFFQTILILILQKVFFITLAKS